MKKVLVMAAALSLLAAPALASSVVNSKHNLSSAGPGSAKTSNYNEVCIFCHTPHGASLKVTGSPLWNRTVTGDNQDATTMYNSSTLETSSRPSNGSNVSGVNNSDAPLCFSSHDGASLNSTLVNPANSLGNAQPNFSSTNMGSGLILDGANALKNDHPIGISYRDAQATDAQLVNYTTLTGAVKVSYGVDGERVWCSSCHDVHDDANYPFLVMSNSASNLCRACHIK